MKNVLILGASGQIAQWLLILLAVAMLSGLAFFIGVTFIEKRQAQAVAGMVPHATPAHSKVAVVYFSRSGNTGLTARHIAKRLGAARTHDAAADT